MPQRNQRQLEVEKYFLAISPRSTTITGRTSNEDSNKRKTYQPTHRVHWSPTRRHREELPPRSNTDFPFRSTSYTEDFTPRSLLTSEFKFEDDDRQASIAKLPQLFPSLKVHRLSDGKQISYNSNPEKEYDEQIWRELNPNKIPPIPPLMQIKEITEEEVDGVIRQHDIPVKYQHYRSRRESIEKAAKENWILTQENKEMQKRHAKQWKSLQILFDKQSNL